MDRLDLGTPVVTLQTTQRDRHAELACILGNIAASVEKFATEVRNLQRSEIDEVQEAFDALKQVGSSTMAHKRNPIDAENVCGLARVVRGFVTPAFENVPLWHERDLTNSSAERFTISHQMVLTEYILTRSTKLFSNLVVNKEAMQANLDRAGPDIMAEAVMMALAERGMGRQEAHEAVRTASMRAHSGEAGFAEALLAIPEVSSGISSDDLEAALRPEAYTGHAAELVELALDSLSG
jgi:adenylosuccinate lyase